MIEYVFIAAGAVFGWWLGGFVHRRYSPRIRYGFLAICVGVLLLLLIT